MGSKKSEDRMSTRLQRVEDELFVLRQKNERLRMTGMENQESKEEHATSMKLRRAQRELKSKEKQAARTIKTYDGRVRLLEDTVGDVQTELAKAIKELEYLRHRHAVMQKENIAAEAKRQATEKDKRMWKEEREAAKAASEKQIDALTSERDKLASDLQELRLTSAEKNTTLERELKALTARVKPLEGAAARADRLEEMVKDLNEARQARQLYEERARSMEDRLDKQMGERRHEKAHVAELEATCEALRNENEEQARALEEANKFAAQREQVEAWHTTMSSLVEKMGNQKQQKKFSIQLAHFAQFMGLE